MNLNIATLHEAAEFLVSQQFPSIKEAVSAELKSLQDEFTFDDISVLPDYFKRLFAFAFKLDPDFANSIRSLFSPALAQIDSSLPVGADDGDLPQPEEEVKRSRGRPKKRKSEPIHDDNPQQRLFVSSKCLVKRTPEGTNVFSSLPLDLSKTHDLELVDEVTEMEILPTSYKNIHAAQQSLKLNDISPALTRPSHMARSHPLYKRRTEHAKLPGFLDFGAFSSFAPTFDSTDAEIGYDEVMNHYVSMLTLLQYEPAVDEPQPQRLDPEPENSQATQTFLSDVVDQKQIDEWLGSAKKSNGHFEPTELESDSSLGPDEVDEYFKKNGIDIEKILQNTREPPSSAEIKEALNEMNNEILLLASLQQDRVQSYKLDAADFAHIYSIAAPQSAESLNPLSEIVEPAKSLSKPKLDDLLTPTAAERVVYQDLVQKLTKIVPHIPTQKLVKKYALRKLLDGGIAAEDSHVHRGALLQPPAPPQQAVPKPAPVQDPRLQQIYSQQMNPQQMAYYQQQVRPGMQMMQPQMLAQAQMMGMQARPGQMSQIPAQMHLVRPPMGMPPARYTVPAASIQHMRPRAP